MADWSINSSSFPSFGEEKKPRRFPYRDPRTGEMLELEASGTPTPDDLPRLIDEARSRKEQEVTDRIDPGTRFAGGAEGKAKEALMEE